MPLLAATGITKQYGTQLCFQDAEFALAEGSRVGLIGANGTGKTSLMKIILGTTDHDGTVSRKKDMRIATLDQDPHFPEGITVREALLMAVDHVFKLERQIHEIHDRLAEGGDSTKDLERLGDLESKFEAEGGYAFENRADRILDGLGFPKERHDESIKTLSGGEKNRVAFGRLLMTEPDLWLLDEPTNHLDLDGILFLEATLAESKSAAIIISHDRRFLDDVTSETWEIEAHRVYTYPRSYTGARELREERIKAGKRAYQKQQFEIDKQEEYIRRFGAGQRARQAAGRKKRLERLDRLTRPEDQSRAVHLQFEMAEKPSMKILKLRDVSMGYGERILFQNLDLEVERGETIAVMGPNGAGKTTLIKALLGDLPATKGEILWGERVHRGFLSQHEEWEDSTITPFRFLRTVEKHMTDLQLKNLLAAMLFRADEIDKPVSVLSGGERKRLMLTKLLLAGNNILILDEPTNHLDLPSREALELALSVYEGTLIVVSHDRYFLDQVADRILWIEEGEWRLTEGGFREAYEARLKAAAKKAAASAKPPVIPILPPIGQPKAEEKSPFAKLNTTQLEEKIIACEEKIAAYNRLFTDPEIFKNSGKVKEIQGNLEKTKAELKALEIEYGSRAK